MTAFWRFFFAVLGTAALAAPAGAQKYPERPIRLIVQSPAGGTADLIARVIAQKLTEGLSAFVRSEIQKMGKAVRASGAKVD